MAKKSNVENAAATWRLLDLAAKKLKDLPGWDDANKARNNALRTLGKAVDAANSHEAWAASRCGTEPER